VYRIPHLRSGHGSEVIGLSDSHLFIADYGPELRGTPDYDAVVRYELSKIEEIAMRL
jgi:hypothetical protein